MLVIQEITVEAYGSDNNNPKHSIIKKKKIKLPRFLSQSHRHHNNLSSSLAYHPPDDSDSPSPTQQPIFHVPKAFQQISSFQQATSAANKNKFISWVSICLLLILFSFIRSISMPYLHKMAEFRKSATKQNSSKTKSSSTSQSFYLSATTFIYLWITSVTCLTIIPHFSSHYNEIIAASLFFPCLGLTVSALMLGRLVIRGCYYCLGGCTKKGKKKEVEDHFEYEKKVEEKQQQSNNIVIQGNHGMELTETISKHDTKNDDTTNATTSASTDTVLSTSTNSSSNNKHKRKIIAFHRPFRKLLKSSTALSLTLCFLYMHCWSRTLGAFKVLEDEHDAGAVCRAVFSPIMLLGFANTDDESWGADESCIWFIWAIVVIGMLVAYVQDEFAHRHYYGVPAYYRPRENSSVVASSTPTSVQNEHRELSNRSSNDNHDDEFDDLTDIDHDDDDDEEEELMQEEEHKEDVDSHDEKLDKKGFALKLMEQKERPCNTLEMCPWYNVVLVSTIFDILVQWKIFLGRFDARSMQPALQYPKKKKRGARQVNGHCDVEGDEIEDDDLDYPGCIFDCRQKSTSLTTTNNNEPISSSLEKDDNKNEDGYWFDFVADVGDGFNSSYQVARLLAQPHLSVRGESGGAKKVLPRGEVLVVGGDLAYPNPSQETYEKRFFRTFEDAMPPPPSFRRGHISIAKPALPVKGWSNCFFDNDEDNGETQGHDEKDILQSYKGPSTFVLPGNHDWYDGLATYSRYILSRDWLGGWLMPQQRSYFALKLPQGWWLLGFDLALAGDIDIEQFKFFANLAAKSIEPSDAVIVVTHQPHWVLDAEENLAIDELPEDNLRELMNHHLAGKVRLRLAGDLHHYTRHVPVVSSPAAKMEKSRHKRSRSWQTSRDAASENEKDLSTLLSPLPPQVKNFVEKNRPELIVSGGGGAFLHPTHCFDKRIRVGKEEDEYVRVCAFPNEKICYRLSWLNIWQFRWRNWRLDVVWAILYFGIASSLFPLCGIYADYLEFNPTEQPATLVLWTIKTVLSLLKQIILTGRLSLVTSIVGLGLCFSITDAKLKPSTRVFWAFSHGFSHIMGALTCLLFVQCVTEWTIYEGIIKVTDVKSLQHNAEDCGIDLASSLYEEYTSHFSHVFDDLCPINATVVTKDLGLDDLASISASERFFAGAISLIVKIFTWLFTEVPILKAILSIFDLPGNIAENHSNICDVLCADDTSCMLGNNLHLYQHIDRATMLSYLGSISLYFITFAIPFAGNLFGTWLALSLNMFKAQYEGGFSSLRLQHWKNFLKLHIKDNGDLEVYSIGLHRVPQNWIKDQQWDGNSSRCNKSIGGNNDSTPSWQWDTPSKWIPEKKSKKFTPEIVDFTCIQKRNGCSFSSANRQKYSVTSQSLPIEK